MVRTRGGSGTGQDASKSGTTTSDKENVDTTKGVKRKSGEQKVSGETKKQKKDVKLKSDSKAEKSPVPAKEEEMSKASDETKKEGKDGNTKASPKSKKPELPEKGELSKEEPVKEDPAEEDPEQSTPAEKKGKKVKKEEDEEKGEIKKQRLTTPVLEFDYDRSQLRDPRPTPGRKRRPHYEEHDIPIDLKMEISSKYYVPKPEKPKGRLNRFQKDDLFYQEGLLNPLHTFHDLYVCHKKGRDGSPSYDRAGFEYDWQRVDEWRKPQPYSKSRIMNSMDRALEKGAREQKEICKAFFTGHSGATGDIGFGVIDYVKDHISKDLGIPWHQIGPKEAQQWEAKGFAKIDYATWWHEPNAEEKKRMMKMHGGCILRKHM